MELTKEYFDQSLVNLMEKIDANLDAKLSSKLDQQTYELKDYTHQGFEAQQEYLDERFNELIVQYDVRDRIEKLEKEFSHFKQKRTSHA